MSTKLRYLLIFLSAIAIVTIHHAQKRFFKLRLETVVVYETAFEDSRDPKVSCQFPILHPFHASILDHISVARPISCFARSKLLTMIDNNGMLVFNKSALLEAGYSPNAQSLDCYYQDIFRIKDDDFHVEYGPKKKMTGLDRPLSDFVYVQCYNFAGISAYKNFHAHVQKIPTVRKLKNDHELGALVIGIDSISRLNFMRQLPLSYRFITDELNGVVLLGFNKVGENTFPNVVPILTGRPLPGLVEKLESWPYIWNEFEREGAATMYSEDLPEFNMFDYLSEGIRKQPTLHYMRTYWLAVEDSLLYKMSSAYCLGSVPKHVIFFNYLKSFFQAYKDSPMFLFSLFNEASHDYVNTVGAIDKDFHDLLKSSYNEDLFNHSVVFILGDHGNRIDPIRTTEVGRIEDRMPMVTVLMPKWADSVYPDWKSALRENSRRLLSSYDIHATFLDILSTLGNKHSADSFKYDTLRQSGLIDKLALHFSSTSIGRSFFKPVPLDRDCDSAGIPDWFCVCRNNEEKISTDDPRSVKAAEAVVDYFNSVLLKGLSNCAMQKLTEVVSSELIKRVNEYRLQLMFTTMPGDGVFEALVNVKEVNGKSIYRIVGEVLRINYYGTQADCLPRTLLANATILRGVCYCI